MKLWYVVAYGPPFEPGQVSYVLANSAEEARSIAEPFARWPVELAEPVASPTPKRIHDRRILGSSLTVGDLVRQQGSVSPLSTHEPESAQARLF